MAKKTTALSSNARRRRGGSGNPPHWHVPLAFSRLTICIQAGQRTKVVNRPELQPLVIPSAANSGPKNFCTACGCVLPLYIYL